MTIDLPLIFTALMGFSILAYVQWLGTWARPDVESAAEAP